MTLVTGLDRGLARLSDDLGISGPPALIEPGFKGSIEAEHQAETPARNGLDPVACRSCGGLWTEPHRHTAVVVRDQIRARRVDATGFLIRFQNRRVWPLYSMKDQKLAAGRGASSSTL